MKYYHNARCAKSREGLKLLEEKGVQPTVVEYMKEPLTPAELRGLLDKLGLRPEELLRTGEKLWKEEFAGKELTDDELILLMIEHPRLMQRPILEKGDKASLGRPPERLLELLG